MKKLMSSVAAVIIGGAIAISGATVANADSMWQDYGTKQNCINEMRLFQQNGYRITQPCYAGPTPGIWRFKYVAG